MNLSCHGGIRRLPRTRTSDVAAIYPYRSYVTNRVRSKKQRNGGILRPRDSPVFRGSDLSIRRRSRTRDALIVLTGLHAQVVVPSPLISLFRPFRVV